METLYVFKINQPEGSVYVSLDAYGSPLFNSDDNPVRRSGESDSEFECRIKLKAATRSEEEQCQVLISQDLTHPVYMAWYRGDVLTEAHVEEQEESPLEVPPHSTCATCAKADVCRYLDAISDKNNNGMVTIGNCHYYLSHDAY